MGSFRNHADLLLKMHIILLSMVKTVVLIDIYVQTVIHCYSKV